MKKLTILIDFDQTINNLNEAWVEYLNERHGTNVKPDDVTDWDITKSFPTLIRDEVFKPLYEEAFWKRVKPLPKAYDNLCKLRNDGHKIYVVTTSNPVTVPIKLNNVLFNYFPFFTYNDVIITSRKQLIIGDVLVDDAPHNLEGDTTYAKILISAPHNKSFDEKSINAIRVDNWDEIYEIINNLSKE